MYPRQIIETSFDLFLFGMLVFPSQLLLMYHGDAFDLNMMTLNVSFWCVDTMFDL